MKSSIKLIKKQMYDEGDYVWEDYYVNIVRLCCEEFDRVFSIPEDAKEVNMEFAPSTFDGAIAVALPDVDSGRRYTRGEVGSFYLLSENIEFVSNWRKEHGQYIFVAAHKTA